MGVTLGNGKKSIDMGYIGFNKLRITVAEITGKEIGEHYKYLEKGVFIFDKQEKKDFFEKYDKKISELEEKHKIPHGVLDFLYQSDCEGRLKRKKIKELYEVIKNHDDDVLYGYTGRQDCAKFKDFKQILKQCVDEKLRLEWY